MEHTLHELLNAFWTLYSDSFTELKISDARGLGKEWAIFESPTSFLFPPTYFETFSKLDKNIVYYRPKTPTVGQLGLFYDTSSEKVRSATISMLSHISGGSHPYRDRSNVSWPRFDPLPLNIADYITSVVPGTADAE